MVFFFFHSVDATNDALLGRFVNDSKAGNSVMKKMFFDALPYLCLIALDNIYPGDELRYDYGDVGSNLWWRKKVHSNLFSNIFTQKLKLECQSS